MEAGCKGPRFFQVLEVRLIQAKNLNRHFTVSGLGQVQGLAQREFSKIHGGDIDRCQDQTCYLFVEVTMEKILIFHDRIVLFFFTTWSSNPSHPNILFPQEIHQIKEAAGSRNAVPLTLKERLSRPSSTLKPMFTVT